MAAIVGVLSPSFEPDESTWSAAKERLSSRSGPWGKACVREGLAVAYRAHRPGGFFEDESLIVLVDGCVDNAASFAREPAGFESDPGYPAAVLARLVKEQGVEALYQLTGHFAIVVVDVLQKRAWLIRDLFGTKPMFYTAWNGGWAFASEIKCLLPLLPKRELNREALAEVFHYRWLAGEQTLVRAVRQVLPSHSLELQPGRAARNLRYSVFRFRPSFEDSNPAVWGERIEQALDEYFAAAAGRYERVGILLSGGVDSSLLAAKATRCGFRKCLGITGRWPGYENPELPNARRVAERLGLEHLVVDVADEYIRQFFPQFVWRMEETPRHKHGFALSLLLTRIAPEVDAIIYGEGADTLLGTTEISWIRNFERRHKVATRIPGFLRRAAAKPLPRRGDGRLQALRRLLLLDPDEFVFHLDTVDNVCRPAEIVPGLPDVARPAKDILDSFYHPDAEIGERYQGVTLYTDCRSRLTMMDRLSAPTGLTVLAPFVSPGIAEIGSLLPSSLKIKDGYSKPLLREIACRYFPREWIYGEKFGFPTPMVQWMEGPLRQWLAILQEERTAARGLFRMEALKKLRVHRDHQILWTAVCLESFIRQFLEGETAAVPPGSITEARG